MYPNLHLASEEERGTNLKIDFIVSSLFGCVVASITCTNFGMAIIVYYGIRFLYYFLTEYYFGKTSGKFETRTRVVNILGDKPSKIQLFKRNICRFFSLTSAVSDHEIAIHDRLSGTFVIQDTKGKQITVHQQFPMILFYFLDAIYGSKKE